MRVRGAQERAEAVEQDAQPRVAAPQPRRALEALLGRRRAHLALDVGQQRCAAVAAGVGEQRQRLVQRERYRLGSRSRRHGDRQRPICRRPTGGRGAAACASSGAG
jgi:hypothetical protein